MVDTDDTDLAILKALRKDARASLRTIASSTGVSVGTVQNRMSKLKKAGILQGFEPRINYDKLGFDVNAVIAMRVKKGKIDSLMDAMQKNKNVMSIYEVTGDVDLFVRVQFRSTAELREFIVHDLSEDQVLSSVTYTVLQKDFKRELV